jgi:hypothetical protein
MNLQLVFLTIKEANKPIRAKRVFVSRQEVLSHYLSFFAKVKSEFKEKNDENERLAFNNFCNLVRLDLRFNFQTYADFEKNKNYKLN